jgi:biotin carboxyl carrier protein
MAAATTNQRAPVERTVETAVRDIPIPKSAVTVSKRAETPVSLSSPLPTQNALMPAPLARAPITGGKSVRELQKLIEEALVVLSNESVAEPPPAEKKPDAPVLGAAPGSAVRDASGLTGRAVKTTIGLAIALVVGLVPLKILLTTASTEAFVDAPLYTVRAPVGGLLLSDDLIIGARVDQYHQLATIERAKGPGFASIPAPSAGKVWQILVPSGSEVASGQEIARIVACSAASVTASVSETVYDGLAPGMPARFNFYGSEVSYPGTVANLLGHATSTEMLAISSASLASDAYRVIVSVPDLGAIPNCAVGRRGEVVFGAASR